MFKYKKDSNFISLIIYVPLSKFSKSLAYVVAGWTQLKGRRQVFNLQLIITA